MAKISVIVPFYNVEKYLKQCLKSLVTQTLNEVEIICIDDGSTDFSGEIAKEFAKIYPQIKVFHQENLGVSVARNKGISMASADYIMFLDGDDFFKKEACSLAFEKIVKTSSDIGVFGITEKYRIFQNPCIMNKNIKRASASNNVDLWKFQTYCVNKIYRKDFLVQNNLTFPVVIKTAEDLIFSLSCLLNTPKYCFIDKSLYIYRKQRKNSATSNFLGVKNDFEALKYFYNTELFKAQSDDIQLKVIEKFCSGAWHYYKRNKSSKDLRYDIKNLLEFIDEKYETQKLRQFKKYNQLKSLFN